MFLKIIEQFWPVIPAFALAWLLHTVSVNRIETAHKTALSNQIISDQLACVKAQALTEEVSHVLLKKSTDTAARLNAALKRLRAHPPACLPITNAAAGNDAAAGANKLSRVGGVEADEFLERAAACDDNTAKLIACQDFVKRERE